MYDLHAVEEGWGDGGQVVGGGDEQHLRQVKRYVQVAAACQGS